MPDTHKIMVIDDNPANLKLVCDLLEFEGFTVCRCIDAESGLTALKTFFPDLILMDVGLPGMDGLTLTKKLKEDPETKGIKIVTLTAFAMKGDRDKAMEAGSDGYITKPIETRKFITQIMPYL